MVDMLSGSLASKDLQSVGEAVHVCLMFALVESQAGPSGAPLLTTRLVASLGAPVEL